MALDPGMVIRISANISELKRNLSEGKLSIETTTAAMQKMASSLQGDKLIQQAHNIVAAVNEIGGAAKLTSEKAEQVNRTITKALEQYKALGREAPQAMVALANATGKTESAWDKFAGVLGKAGPLLGALGIGFGVSAVVDFGRRILADADALQRMSDKTGISTDWLQRFQVAGDDAGNTVDEMTLAINQMQNRMASGDKSFVNALRELHINLADFKALRPEEQFVALSDALRGLQDPAEFVRIGIDLMGKSFTNIAPTMKRGFDDVKNAAVGMSKETVQRLDEIGDAWERMWRRTKGIVGNYIASTNLARIAGEEAAKTRDEQATKNAMDKAAKTSVLATNGLLPIGIPDDATIAQMDKNLDRVNALGKKAFDTQKKIREDFERYEDSLRSSQFIGPNMAPADIERRIPQLTDGILNLGKTTAVALLPTERLTVTLGEMSHPAQAAGKALLDASRATRSFSDSWASLKSGDFTSVFKDFGSFLKGGTDQIGTGFLQGIGNMALGGVTSLISAGLGAAWTGLKGLFSDKEAEQVNDMRDEFINAAGGLGALNAKAHDAGQTLDKLLNVSRVKDFKDEVARLQEALDFQAGAMSELRAAEEKYHLSLNSTSADLYRSYQVLVGAGHDATTVLTNMKGDWQNLVSEARSFGITLPEQLQPILEKMVNLGLLTDENGEKFGSLEEAGLSFGGQVQGSFDKMIEAVDRLVAAIKSSLGLALTEAERRILGLAPLVAQTASNIITAAPVRPPNVPSYEPYLPPEEGGPGYGEGPGTLTAANGFDGMVRRPTWFLTGEAGPERVTVTPAGRGGGGDQVIHTYVVLDERVIAESVKRVNAMDDQLRFKGRAA